MYQGDESFTFRTDHQGRRNRQQGRLRYDPPETAPYGYGGEPAEGPGGPAPVGRTSAEERIARLEAAVARLEGLVTQMEETLIASAENRHAPPLGRPHGEERAIEMLEAHSDEDIPTAGATVENLRVSLFADNGASAVLGQVRILE